MITSLFLDVIFFIVNLLATILLVLPDVSVNSGFGLAINNVSSYLGSLNTILPIDILFTVIGLILGIELIIASYKIIMWIIRRIPTQS